MRKISLAVLIVGAALYAARQPLLSGLGGFLVDASKPAQADIVLVLAGDGRGSRILTAAQLVRDGFAPKVLVSGPDGNYGVHECDMAVPFAVKAGYPEPYFEHFENTARSTADEARQSAQRLRQLHVHKILLVTNDYHTHRAGILFRKAAPDLEFIVVAAPDQFFSATSWWHNREGQKTMFYEFVKTMATWINL